MGAEIGIAVRPQMSEAEWQARVDLAACYRLLAHFGMTDLINNHVTLQVPGEEDSFFINPYGLLYAEMRASDFYKIDLSGNVVYRPEGMDLGVNRGGFVIHSAIHEARPDAVCVIHVHTRASMAVSAMQCGLLPLTQTAMWFYDVISYHDFQGPVVDAEEKQQLVANLGSTNAMIMRNHGTLTIGRSPAEAFVLAYLLELACQAQVDAMAARTELVMPSADVGLRTAKVFRDMQPNGAGILEWKALLRMLDRQDRSYAT